MANPDTAASHVEFPEDKETSAEPTFDAAAYEKDVATACSEMKFDDDGKWQAPEDMSPEMQYAVNSERRRRDTQSSRAKLEQDLSASNRKSTALLERLESSITPTLTVEQAEELEDLKESSPDAWRAKLNEYDETAYSKHLEDIAEIDDDASQGAEETRRTALLEQFLSSNPDIALNDSVFENDLPRGLTSKLSEGKVTFEEFLEEAKTFLLKGKKIATTENEEEPNLSASSGSHKPDAAAVKQGAASAEDYKNEIY